MPPFVIVVIPLGALPENALAENLTKSQSVLCLSADNSAVSNRKTSDEMCNGYR